MEKVIFELNVSYHEIYSPSSSLVGLLEVELLKQLLKVGLLGSSLF